MINAPATDQDGQAILPQQTDQTNANIVVNSEPTESNTEPNLISVPDEQPLDYYWSIGLILGVALAALICLICFYCRKPKK